MALGPGRRPCSFGRGSGCDRDSDVTRDGRGRGRTGRRGIRRAATDRNVGARPRPRPAGDLAEGQRQRRLHGVAVVRRRRSGVCRGGSSDQRNLPPAPARQPTDGDQRHGGRDRRRRQPDVARGPSGRARVQVGHGNVPGPSAGVDLGPRPVPPTRTDQGDLHRGSRVHPQQPGDDAGHQADNADHAASDRPGSDADGPPEPNILGLDGDAEGTPPARRYRRYRRRIRSEDHGAARGHRPGRRRTATWPIDQVDRGPQRAPPRRRAGS